jgi:hypothetical protein
MCAAAIIATVYSIVRMVRKGGQTNKSLTVLTIGVLGYYTAVFVQFVALAAANKMLWTYSYTIAVLCEGTCHWTVTQTYLKVAIETPALLDKDIYRNNSEKLLKVESLKRYVKIAATVVMFVVVVAALMSYISLKKYF